MTKPKAAKGGQRLANIGWPHEGYTAVTALRPLHPDFVARHRPAFPDVRRSHDHNTCAKLAHFLFA